MAADITSPAAALQAATLLVPKAQQDANPFFSNAARHLMSAALLAQTEFTRPLLQYGEHPATFQNILSTLLTRIAPFEIIAAAWDRAEHKLSLRAWLEQEAILILANDEDNRAAIDTINQLLVAPPVTCGFFSATCRNYAYRKRARPVFRTSQELPQTWRLAGYDSTNSSAGAKERENVSATAAPVSRGMAAESPRCRRAGCASVCAALLASPVPAFRVADMAARALTPSSESTDRTVSFMAR